VKLRGLAGVLFAAALATGPCAAGSSSAVHAKDNLDDILNKVLSGSDAAPPRPPATATPSLAEMARDQVRGCWVIDADAVPVTLQVMLNVDGTLAAPPQPVPSWDALDPRQRKSAVRAIDAIKICAPFKFPADRFADWHVMSVMFRPPRS